MLARRAAAAAATCSRSAPSALSTAQFKLNRRFLSSSSSASEAQLTPAGFIGLGNMGGHMARNLIKTGRPLVVYDVSQGAIDSILRDFPSHVTIATSPEEVAYKTGQFADTAIVTMLPSSPHVHDTICGPKGLLAGLRSASSSASSKGQNRVLLIDASTIDPVISREIAAQAQREENVTMVDAPVSGGVGGAEAGTLTFMVGGSEQAFERSKVYLSAMGKNIVHCGDNGTGQIAKVCNNLVLGISMIGVSEAMNLGVKLGADPQKLAGIFNTSSARCWSSDTYNPVPGVMPGVPSSRNWEGGFGVDLMAKDLGLAVAAAEKAKAPLPLGAQARQFYAMVSAHGSGKKDFGYAYKFLSADDDGDKKK